MNATEKIIILPPGLHALAALCAFDKENDDGLPDGKYYLGGVKVTQDGNEVVCEATNGKIAGRYTANIGKRMDGQTRGQVFEAIERYPNFDAIIPKDEPLVSVRFDPELMIDLLRACQRVAGYSANGGIQGVRFVSAVDSIPAWRRRLRAVTILNQDGMALLEKIEDQAGVAIYCDPPYLVKKAEYVHDFRAEQHVRLAELLRRFRLARIVVSYYASPQLEQLYPGWTQLRYNMVKGLSVQGRRGAVAEKAQEVLLVNGPSAEEGGLLF